MTQSRVRQLFSDDLDDDECVHHCAPVTVTSPRYDRPVTGWAVTTDRALRVRWGLATTVSQSLHVEYDRMRLVEADGADPSLVQVTYFDAARAATASWYQEMRLRADTSDLAATLPELVSRRRRHLAEPVEAPTASGDGDRSDGRTQGTPAAALVIPEPPAHEAAEAAPRRPAHATRRVTSRGRRRLTRS